MASDDNETMEEQLTRLKDIMEIQELQHRYQQWNALYRGDKLLELFARKEPDVSVEAGVPGVYEGWEFVKQFFDGYKNLETTKGVLIEHHAVCPVIEVAKDGKTAKGTWLSPGLSIIAAANIGRFHWAKYTCDYIKEEGKWKIWHLRYFPPLGVFQGETPPSPKGPPVIDHGQYNNPKTEFELYPDGPNHALLEPPEPYDTYRR